MVISFSFVMNIHLLSDYQLPRDDVKNVLRRSVGCILSCILSVLYLYYVVGDSKVLTVAIGVFNSDYKDNSEDVYLGGNLFKTFVSEFFLFFGPLFHHYLDGDLSFGPFFPLMQWFSPHTFEEFKENWHIWLRAYIVGPFAEEFVFRFCFYRCYISLGGPHGSNNNNNITTSNHWEFIFIGSCCFGIAHLHHFLEHIIHNKHVWRRAVAIVLFQFTYTTVFSYIAFYFYLQSNLLNVILLHAFCNWMGSPNPKTFFMWPTNLLFYPLGVFLSLTLRI